MALPGGSSGGPATVGSGSPSSGPSGQQAGAGPSSGPTPEPLGSQTTAVPDPSGINTLAAAAVDQVLASSAVRAFVKAQPVEAITLDIALLTAPFAGVAESDPQELPGRRRRG